MAPSLCTRMLALGAKSYSFHGEETRGVQDPPSGSMKWCNLSTEERL